MPLVTYHLGDSHLALVKAVNEATTPAEHQSRVEHLQG